MFRIYYNFRFIPFLFFCTVSLGTFLYIIGNYKILFEERNPSLKQINEFIKSLKAKNIIHSYQECILPILDISDPNILLMLRDIRTARCGASRDWVEIDGSTAKISKWAKQTYGDIECSFMDILRKTEDSTYIGKPTITNSEYKLKASDVVRVTCKDSLQNKWSKVLLGVRSDRSIRDRSGWSKLPRDSLKLNVLMIGIDSLSHNMWKRKLPKTYQYATKNLGGVALNGYNIVGDGTIHALLPILTGKTQLELPETRKTMGSDSQFIDIYPFIWNEFKNNGYVTLFGEDHLSLRTFSSRLKGFYKQPVDHYARPFYQNTKPTSKERDFCYGELSKLQIMTSYVKNMYKVYWDKPKFMFIFYADYTYNSLHYAANADDDLAEFLKVFKNSGSLNNTLLILMSDHGSRTTYFRSSQQGKQEERLPGFIFIFPRWFRRKYTEAFLNLRSNADRLTTPFDIHETLKSVLHYDGTDRGITKTRGISLFKNVPLSRSCRDADINPEWCTCLDWEKIHVPNSFISEAASVVVKFINGMLNSFSSLCGTLRLKKILWSSRMFPNEYLLKFKVSDVNGLVKDLSDIVSVKTDIYRIIMTLGPGDMNFEAYVVYLIFNNRFYVSEKYIKRMDMMNKTSHCFRQRRVPEYIKKFCYCKYNT